MSSFGESVARAREARLSMMRLTHSICTAVNGDSRRATAPAHAVTTATTLTTSCTDSADTSIRHRAHFSEGLVTTTSNITAPSHHTHQASTRTSAAQSFVAAARGEAIMTLQTKSKHIWSRSSRSMCCSNKQKSSTELRASKDRRGWVVPETMHEGIPDLLAHECKCIVT